MNLDELWENLFSEEAALVQAAWDTLGDSERRAVRAHLKQVRSDPERIDAQRAAAVYALRAVDALPPGALEFARTLARDTGLRLSRVDRAFGVSTKPDGTLVTSVDVETDQALAAAVASRYPGHGVLTEEHNKVYHGEEWCWVIDPIDGTTNFNSGYPIWGTLIGLLHYGDPIMGVTEFPTLGMQFHGLSGEGAWCNGEPIHAAAATRLRTNDLWAVCSRTLKRGVPHIPNKLRLAGSVGSDLMMLASGRCTGVFGLAVHVWDIAAAWPIVMESGARLRLGAQDGLFPLVMNQDYADVAFWVLGACTPELLEQAQSRFSSITT